MMMMMMMMMIIIYSSFYEIWIQLAQDTDQYGAAVKTVINLRLT
jgi:hypothetical protein